MTGLLLGLQPVRVGQKQITIGKSLNGGCVISIGSEAVELEPAKAVNAAKAILGVCGIKLDLRAPAVVLTTRGIGGSKE